MRVIGGTCYALRKRTNKKAAQGLMVKTSLRQVFSKNQKWLEGFASLFCTGKKGTLRNAGNGKKMEKNPKLKRKLKSNYEVYSPALVTVNFAFQNAGVFERGTRGV